MFPLGFCILIAFAPPLLFLLLWLLWMWSLFCQFCFTVLPHLEPACCLVLPDFPSLLSRHTILCRVLQQ
jgi:hypothetical protein